MEVNSMNSSFCALALEKPPPPPSPQNHLEPFRNPSVL